MDKVKKKSNGLKTLMTFIYRCKIPVYWYVIALILPTLVSLISVKAIEVATKLQGGSVKNPALVWSYIYYAVLLAVISVPGSLITKILNWVNTSRIQKVLLKHAISLENETINKKGSLNLVSKITFDPTNVSDFIGALLAAVPGLVTFFYPFSIIYKQNKIFAIGVTIYILFEVVVKYIIADWIRKTQRKYLLKFSNLTAHLGERLKTIKFIKTSGTEELEVNLAMNKIDEMYKSQLNLQKAMCGVSVFGEALDTIRLVITYILGARLVNGNLMDLTGFLLFVTMSGQMKDAFLKILVCIPNYQNLQGTIESINELLDLPKEKIKREVEMIDTLEDINFNNVNFNYGDKEILKNINFQIPKGKTTAIVGSSGAGKTTIINLIERLYTPTEGNITLGDTPADKIHLDKWRKAFGYIVQGNKILPGTIKEIITFGLDQMPSEKELIEVAKYSNIYDYIDSLPEKFDTIIDDPEKLSSGQRQRLGIARALMVKPNYLILDEATSNLDSENELDVMNSIKEIMIGKTTIIVAHKLSTIMNADNIIVMDKGRIVAEGRHSELIINNDLYKKLCNYQNL